MLRSAFAQKGCAGCSVELQKIDYRRYPNAAHDLLRSFLECALKAHFQDTGKTLAPRRGQYVFLDQVLDEFTKEMATLQNTRLRQVAERIKASPNMVSYSAAFLNAINHNPDIFVTPIEVANAWDAMVPILRFAVNPAKSNV
jgi:hypothetical protein